MQSANRPSSRRHRTPLPDPQFVSSATVALLDNLCDPNSDITVVERDALVVVYQLMGRLARVAGRL